MATLMPPVAPPTINSLALLGLKCGANVFDLSSDMSNVSIRDQVVRARMLVRDLSALPQRPSTVLVVGAGFGGISAALACHEAGMSATVLDANKEPFRLQAKPNDRMVGPLMYEWPMHNSKDQTYPPAVAPQLPDNSILGKIWTSLSPGTQPLHAECLAKHAQGVLTSVLNADPFPVYLEVDRGEVKRFVVAFHQGSLSPLSLSHAVKWPTGKGRRNRVIPKPDVIILGGGFGEERIALELPAEQSAATVAKGEPFWGQDHWTTASSDLRYGVFGAGDGALQDVLRALTGNGHPLKTLEDMRRSSCTAEVELDKVEPELLAIELESRLAATWTQVWEQPPAIPNPPTKNHRGYIDQWTDRCCASIASRLAGIMEVQEAVKGVLRSGTGEVHHVFREEHFTKTYLLNRFLVHLIYECQSKQGNKYPGKIAYRKSSKVPVICGIDMSVGATSGPFRVWLRNAPNDLVTPPVNPFDKIAVRYGPDPKTLPGRHMVGMTKEAISERTTIGQVPLPIVAHPMIW